MPQESPQIAADGTVKAFLALDDNQKRATLGMLSDAAKQALLAGIKASSPSPQPSILPKITGISAAPALSGMIDKASQWLGQAGEDIQHGTGQTAIGRGLRKLGAPGLDAGQPEEVGKFMGSPLLGATRAAKGLVESAPGGDHPVQAMKDIVGGGMQALTIPSMVMLPGGVEAGAEAIPSAARAGSKLNEVSKVIGSHPVPMTNRLSDVLQRTSRLAQSMPLPKVIGGFIDRIADLNQPPITFEEARDFYSTAADKLSPEEMMSLKPRMVKQIAEFKSALGDTLNSVASKSGLLEKYQQGLKEYHNAMRIARVGTAAKKAAIKAALVGGAGAAARAGYDIFKAGE